MQINIKYEVCFDQALKGLTWIVHVTQVAQAAQGMQVAPVGLMINKAGYWTRRYFFDSTHQKETASCSTTASPQRS